MSPNKDRTTKPPKGKGDIILTIRSNAGLYMFYDKVVEKGMSMAEYKRVLLMEFANFLNTHKGLEDCRFDFMVLDFLENESKEKRQ